MDKNEAMGLIESLVRDWGHLDNKTPRITTAFLKEIFSIAGVASGEMLLGLDNGK